MIYFKIISYFYKINSIKEIIVQGITEGIFFEEFPHQAAIAVYLAISVFIHPNSFEVANRKQNIESVRVGDGSKSSHHSLTTSSMRDSTRIFMRVDKTPNTMS